LKTNFALPHAIQLTLTAQKKIQSTLQEVVPIWLGYFSSLLQKHKTPFFGGNSPSYADFKLFVVLQKIWELEGSKVVLEKFPDIAAFKDRVANRPRIKSYYANNPYK